MHVKDNILYYMQAIWSHEPPDQRFFRLYNIDVPVHRAAGHAGERRASRRTSARTPRALDALLGTGHRRREHRDPTVDGERKKLVEVADLDTVLGYKGNYTIFPLKENNLITLHMMQDYLDVGDELLLRDPDETGDYSDRRAERLATCL